MPTKEAKLLEILRKNGVIRARDLNAFDIPREYLVRLKNKGLIERREVRRGAHPRVAQGDGRS